MGNRARKLYSSSLQFFPSAGAALHSPHMRTILLAVFFGLFAASSALLAQSTPASTQTSPVPAVTPSINIDDPAAATRAWLDTVPPEKRARSDAYFEGGYWLIAWNFLMGAAVSILLLTSRISARLRDFCERTTRYKALQVAIYALALILLTDLIGFPLHTYQHFFREHAYGLATQNFSQWFGEQMKFLLIQLIITPILLIGLYAVFRRAPRTWWVWGAVVSVIFLMISGFLAPVYIEPIFNTYKPLTDPALKDPILAMARANEIPVTQVFEVDASRQTTRISANVAGFLGTTRIALNDNLLKQCSLPEIREVMAHEMGHYVLNHSAKLLIYFGLFFLVGFAVVRLAFDASVRKWGTRWDVRNIGDPAGLPLLSLLLAAYFFVITPIRNTAIRATEREADAFSINTSREPEGMAKVALKLGTYRKLDPTPLEEFIFFDHPSGRARIRMAMDWKAAHLPAGSQ